MMEPIIITVINQKGGVGKTAISVNLAGALTSFFDKVLLIDFDPQADASAWMCRDYQRMQTRIEDILRYGVKNNTEDDTVLAQVKNMAKEASVDTYINKKKLSLITTSLSLDHTKNELFAAGERKATSNMISILKHISTDYDLVIIDTSPYISSLHYITVGASDFIIIPITLDPAAISGAINVINMVLSDVKKYYNNPKIELLGIVVNLFEKISNISKAMGNNVINTFGDLLFNTRIKSTVKIRELPVMHGPLNVVYPKSTLNKEIQSLSKEVYERILRYRGEINE